MYEFGPFRMDPNEQVLWRGGKVVPLSPKLFDTLLVLVENSGHLVDKDEMLRRVWPDTFVEEGNLTKNVFLLRKLLENSDDVSYIETVPKRGYRFVASVKVTGNGSGTVATELVDLGSVPAEPAGLVGQEVNIPFLRAFLSRRWMVLAGLAAVGLGIISYGMWWRLERNSSKPQIRSLAVLPTQNLSGDDPAQEYFADGMTESLITNLGQISALRVVSRTSMMTFKGSKKPLPEIARELNVDGVVESSVQRENGRVKITIQLIHGPTDTHLWAREYERAETDVLKLLSEMGRAIAEEIRIQITPEDRIRLSSTRAVNPAAHDAYVLGRFHFWKFIVDDYRRAIEHFERAIQIDPGYAPAYAGLSMAWQCLGIQGGVKDVFAKARAAAEKALELDGRLAEAQVARGHLQLFYEWDWQGAENSMRRALELDPNNLDGHFNYALVHLGVGRFAEAIAEIQKAEQLDPLSHQVQANFGRILLHAGRHEEALRRANQAIEREPRSPNAQFKLAQVYEAMGRYTEALDVHDKARALRGAPPDNPRFRSSVAHLYARMGKRSEAKRRLLEGLKNPPRADILAGAYAALGNNDEAFRLLFEMVGEREGRSIFVGTDPQFASLHSDPRWQALRRRMNLPVAPQK